MQCHPNSSPEPKPAPTAQPSTGQSSTPSRIAAGARRGEKSRGRRDPTALPAHRDAISVLPAAHRMERARERQHGDLHDGGEARWRQQAHGGVYLEAREALASYFPHRQLRKALRSTSGVHPREQHQDNQRSRKTWVEGVGGGVHIPAIRSLAIFLLNRLNR